MYRADLQKVKCVWHRSIQIRVLIAKTARQDIYLKKDK